MDCRETQQLLEAVRPDTEDLFLPEIAAAEQHLTSCLDCQEAFQKISRFDRLFGAAVRNTPAPVGLNQRLLAAIALESSKNSHESPIVGETVQPIPSPARPASRRRVMQWIGAASAAMLLSLSAFWFWPTAGEQLPLEELLSGFGGDFQKRFDENFPARLPQDGWDSRRLRLEGPFGYPATERSAADLAAIYEFRLAISQGNVLSGRLLVIPASRLSNPPPASSMLEVAAVSSSDGSYSSATWSEGDLVFICFVDGHAGNFTALQRALAPQLG